MKRFFCLILILTLILAGCSSGSAVHSETAVTFTDDLGRTVTVDDPKRVAALLGSFAQVWMLAGGEIIATADDAWEDLQLPLPEDAVNLGNTKQLSLELLMAAQPDFILASTNTRQNLQWQDTLEAMQIPVAYFDVADFSDYLNLLEICTRITGREDLYRENGLDIRQHIDAVLERSRERGTSPRVLCMVASASNISAKSSRNNVLGEMLAALGCVNLADSEAALLENLSMEYILQEDPDHIFIVQRGDDTAGMLENIARELESDPLWGQLTAVKEGRVHIMEKNLYNLKPNHRWAEAYEKLEEILKNEG